MTRIPPHQIGFDFDGVIADTAEAFLRLACLEYGRCDFTLEQITRFEVTQCLDMDADSIEAIFQQILLDPLGTGLRPMEGAPAVLTELAARAPVTIITARPHPDAVHAWLASQLPAPAVKQCRVIAMGDHDAKPAHIRHQGLTHFIDDRAETCLQLQQAGLHPIVYSQPWNRNGHNLPCVDNWQQIRELVIPAEETQP